MTKECQVTKRRPMRGRTYTTRGIAKKKKGIGIKITGKTKRRFLPNLMHKRFWLTEEGRFVSLKLSAQGIRLIDKVGLYSVVQRLRSEGQVV